MSVLLAMECDGCRFESSDIYGDTKPQIRSAARKRGWTSMAINEDRGKTLRVLDFCPECTDTHKKAAINGLFQQKG